MKKYKDIISGSFLFVVGLVYFALSFTIKLSFIDRVVGSRMFPQIIGILMMALSLYIVISGVLSLRRAEAAAKQESEKTLMEKGEEAENAGEDTSRKGSIKVVLVLLSFGLYCLLLDGIGFSISTILYLFSQMILMGDGKPSVKRLAFYAALSVAVSVCVYYMFNTGFNLILPKASWF